MEMKSKKHWKFLEREAQNVCGNEEEDGSRMEHDNLDVTRDDSDDDIIHVVTYDNSDGTAASIARGTVTTLETSGVRRHFRAKDLNENGTDVVKKKKSRRII